MDRQTDRQTERRMDRQNCDPQERASIAALRGKNVIQQQMYIAINTSVIFNQSKLITSMQWHDGMIIIIK